MFLDFGHSTLCTCFPASRFHTHCALKGVHALMCKTGAPGVPDPKHLELTFSVCTYVLTCCPSSGCTSSIHPYLLLHYPGCALLLVYCLSAEIMRLCCIMQVCFHYPWTLCAHCMLRLSLSVYALIPWNR
jgi:hypothetical protein